MILVDIPYYQLRNQRLRLCDTPLLKLEKTSLAIFIQAQMRASSSLIVIICPISHELQILTLPCSCISTKAEMDISPAIYRVKG